MNTRRLARLLLAAGWLATLSASLPPSGKAAPPGPGSPSAASPRPVAEPAAPRPSPSVQAFLDEAGRLAGKRQWLPAQKAAERALLAARQASDAAGEAAAEAARARALEGLGRVPEAVGAWQRAAAAWQSAGNGPGRIEALANVARLLTAGKPEEARTCVAQAVALGRSEAVRPLAAAQALQAAGQQSLDQRLLPAAQQFWDTARGIQERWAPGSLDLARSLNGLGEVLHTLEGPAAAQAHHQRALDLQEKLAPDSLDVARSLSGLGLAVAARGEFARAKPLHERALSIRQRLAPDSLDVAESLSRVAALLGMGTARDQAVAREYLQRGLRLREALRPNSLEIAKSLMRLGELANRQGDFAAAEGFYRRALALQQRLVPGSPDVAQSLLALGTMRSERSDWVAARDYLREALAIQQKLAPESMAYARTLNNLGALFAHQQDMAAAIEYWRRALPVVEKVAPDSDFMGLVLNNLSHQEDRAAAKECRQRALAIWKKLFPGHPANENDDLWDQSKEAQEQGDLIAARAFGERILANREKLNPDSEGMIPSLRGLGDIAQKQGDLAAAKAAWQHALVLCKKLLPNSLEEAGILRRLGQLARQQGDWVEAERNARQAWEIWRRQSSGVIGDEARQAFDAVATNYTVDLIRAQLALKRDWPAFETLEKGRAQALQHLRFERQVALSSTNPMLWGAFRAAVAERNRAEQAVSKCSDDEALARHKLAAGQEAKLPPETLAREQSTVSAAAQARVAAQGAYSVARVKADEIGAKIVESAGHAFAPASSLEQTLHALPTATLFAAFSVADEQTSVFLLSTRAGTKPSLSVSTIAITPRELQILVSALQRQLSGPNADSAGVVAAGRALFSRLFPSTAQKKIQASKRLLISPDGLLWEVPFAALVTNPHGTPRYLGMEKALTYTPSLTVFAQSRANRPRLAHRLKARAVVVGDPIFDRRPTLLASAATRAAVTRGERSILFRDGKPPERLPATRQEASAIAHLYGAAALLETGATEAALRSRVGEANVIHLATHGYLHPSRAMSSGVLLTVPEKEPEIGATNNDGALQAWEIYSQLKLKAELVVLSACETGRGENVRGEGIVGLTRALQYAGAHSIVASQWSVADESTRHLMVAFHQKLRAGLAKDEALRQAMMVVRRDARWAHPYYWAAFFLTGDPDNPNLGKR